MFFFLFTYLNERVAKGAKQTSKTLTEAIKKHFEINFSESLSLPYSPKFIQRFSKPNTQNNQSFGTQNQHMDYDQVVETSKNTETPLSQIHGSLKDTEEETIHVKSKLDDCEDEIKLEEQEVKVVEKKEKGKEDKKKEEEVENKMKKDEEKKKEEEKQHFIYYMQLYGDIIKEEQDKKKKEEEEEKKKKEEEEKKKELGQKKEEEEKTHFMHYNQLYKDIIHGNWEETKRAFDIDSSAITGSITYSKSTALHIAVTKGVSIHFIKNLVNLMSGTDLETFDGKKETALHCAATVGYTEAAKVLVKMNPSLAKSKGLDNRTPIELAAHFAHKDTVRLLLPVTRHEDPSVFTGESGAFILNYLILAEFYDIAIYLLKCYPNLACEKDGDGCTALFMLALKPHAFLSGNQLNFLQRFLYKSTFVEKVIVHRREDVENPAAETEYASHEPRESRRNFKFLQNIHEKMRMRRQALQLTRMLCAEIEKTNPTDTLLAAPIQKGVPFGTHELVWEIVKTFPEAILYLDENQRHMFHLAVLHLQEKVYNLVYQMGLQKHYMLGYRDKWGNNILHLAGMLGPSGRIYGAAFHMQRELQWFKELEKVVPPFFKLQLNNDRKKPRDLFTEEHKDLVKKGEEWMKNTASSCTVVAALIITVVFAAAFTLPGGNDSEGYPIFLNDLSFLIYSVSNALALVASSTSVLMFLRILTSRYSEEDFLKALPMRLCIGLLTLFLSIAFMLAAFSAALRIVLFHRLSWVAAPIIVLACIPLTLFVFLQFPLLIRMVSSTFGASIFHQQSKDILY